MAGLKKTAPPRDAGPKGIANPAADASSPPAEIPPPSGHAEIRARFEKGRRTRFEIGAARVVLGRDDSAGLPVPLDGVSREHASIEWDGQRWWIEDLRSTNGTFVNGERVSRERLAHLDVISLGRGADLVFLVRKGEAAPAVRKGIVRAALIDAEGLAHEIAPGEISLGRSAACNVAVDATAVSKVHARIERSSDQLLVEDLASSNGTFVNGTRVRTAVLRDGDTLSLAGEAVFKVVVEQGEVRGSGVIRVAPAAEGERPHFSGEWKTRFEWDSQELAAIQAIRASSAAKQKTTPAVPVVPAALARAGATTPMPAVKVQPAVPAVPAATPTPAPAPPAPAPSAAAPSAVPPPKAAPPVIEPTVADAPIPPEVREDPRIAMVRFDGPVSPFVIAEPGRVEVGRAVSAGRRIDHATVSRRHVAVTLSEDRQRVTVADLGAANPARVNGLALSGTRDLVQGDVLELGSVKFTVTVERA